MVLKEDMIGLIPPLTYKLFRVVYRGKYTRFVSILPETTIESNPEMQYKIVKESSKKTTTYEEEKK